MLKQVVPPISSTLRPIVLAAAIFITFSIIYGVAAEHLSYLAFENNDAFFDADTYDTTRAMEQLTFSGDMQRHLLFSLVASTLVRIVNFTAAFGVRDSIIVTIALLGAINVATCFLLLRAVLKDDISALAFAALYGVAISNLVIFSLPETYSVTNMFIFLYVACLVPRWRSLSPSDGILLSIVAGVGALANPPLLSLVSIHAFVVWRNENLRQALRVGIVGSTVAIGLYFILAAVIRGPSLSVRYPAYYLLQWASFDNFIDLEAIAHVITTFLMFSVVSPVAVIGENIELRDAVGFLARPTAFAAALVWLGLVTGSIVSSVREDDVFAQALLVWTALLTVFYVFFYPWGAILYSPQISIPLIVVVATLGSRRLGRWNWAAGAILAALCGYHHVTAVLSTPVS